MNKRELNLLEKAFEAELNTSMGGGLGIFQTKSKLAEKLVEDGLLEKKIIVLSDLLCEARWLNCEC